MRFHVSSSVLSLVLVAAATAFGAGCSQASVGEPTGASDEALSGPGNNATDARTPELGDDLSILDNSQISLADGVAKVTAENGPVIEAKFELGDDGKLSLSVYPAAKGLAMDAERNVFQELSGDPTATPFSGSLETFADQEHLTRSSRDLTLVQLSKLGVADAITRSADMGNVFWAIPTVRSHRAGFGVYALSECGHQVYRFIDGGGARGSNANQLRASDSLGAGPGAGASDARTPELGTDLSIVKTSQVKMSAALAAMETAHGPAIEAKFEIGDDGKLSLSIYPVGKGITTDAERNTFFELAGDPTAATYAPEKAEFTVPDVEHLTRSARDLTLVQTANITLRQAVDAVDRAVPGGFVYWAIPTIRDTRSGYGVYTLGTDGQPHYFFVN
jgi:hypothetical protein